MLDDQSIGANGERFDQAGDSKNNLAIGVAVAILGVMAVAIAIDFSSVPNLALLTIVLIGGLIAALIAWG